MRVVKTSIPIDLFIILPPDIFAVVTRNCSSIVRSAHKITPTRDDEEQLPHFYIGNDGGERVGAENEGQNIVPRR